MTVTRKMEIRVNASSKEELNEAWKKLRDIGYATYRAYNQAISDYHIANMIALETRELPKDERKDKQADAFQFIYGSLEGYKDGVQNRVYQRIRENFPVLPSCVASPISRLADKKYKADMKNGLAKGNKSLAHFKLGCPIPVPSSRVSDINLEDELSFMYIGLPFVTVGLKKDNNNYTMVSTYLDRWCDSNIIIDGNKLYLLACLDIDVKKVEVDYTKSVGVDLGIACPAVCALSEGFGAKFIGNITFFKKRIAMDKHYNRKKSKISVSGGHGRKKIDDVTRRLAGKRTGLCKEFEPQDEPTDR